MTLADHIQHMQPAAGANPAGATVRSLGPRAFPVASAMPGANPGRLHFHIHALELAAQRAESLGLSWAPVLRAQAAVLRAALPAVLAVRLAWLGEGD